MHRNFNRKYKFICDLKYILKFLLVRKIIKLTLGFSK